MPDSPMVSPEAPVQEKALNPQLFFAFLLVAAALACTPGVDWAYTIAAGLRQRSFVPAVAGLCGGYVLHTVLLVAGLAALLTGMPGVLGWITLAGAGYLLWLGVGTLRSWRGASFSADRPAVRAAPGSGRSFRAWEPAESTPRAALLRGAGPPVRERRCIPSRAGAVRPARHDVCAAGGPGLHRRRPALARPAAARPGAARVVTLASGLIMVALGAVLLGEQLVPFLAGIAWQ